MKLVVRCYGPARARVDDGVAAVDVAAEATVVELVTALAVAYPALAALLPECAVAVGDEIVTRSYVLRDDDQVALLPPVAGG